MTTRWILFSVFTSISFAQTPMPGLAVCADVLARHWVVRDETFTPDLCSVQEDGISPGDHRVLRFTVTTPNIGDADLALGDLYEFATCHRHYHFRHYATYELVDPLTSFVWRAASA